MHISMRMFSPNQSEHSSKLRTEYSDGEFRLQLTAVFARVTQTLTTRDAICELLAAVLDPSSVLAAESRLCI